MGCVNSNASAPDGRWGDEDTALALALSQEEQWTDPATAELLLQTEEEQQLAEALSRSLEDPPILQAESERLRAIAQAENEQHSVMVG
mmetsp:Transcript_97159/g.173070  ORF Transcript_97159/g.173070 Transcript_97159/m.173070 type:complete len:88 (+) Transcript_97159:57-320(+)|eukprot:CAMPEP_0197622398 /NCGR_PEP_ID=MMETSP1338-20131121/2733_1 /TAXON_ID=43686 ORGANISM="Pelagodinium beii, Strain RCC1491" /NCGR_SAMPLE_ID=MMETSP1338 /ASSEMBLY_ACC=CAM_ASM_000754 /LENGTH=87 /DNA_ID=CAMNT_0043192131 /DNA_START=56 /DNA_END=319 /DNA_ORIENTATION=+